MILFWFLVVLHAGGVVCDCGHDIPIDNPLEKEHFTKTTDWKHYEPEKEVSACIADFHHEQMGCRRFVLFIAKVAHLAYINVPCVSTSRELGLVRKGDTLWYFEVGYIKPIEPANSGEHEYLLVTAKKYKNQNGWCEKSNFVVQEGLRDPVRETYLTNVPSTGPDADKDCKELVFQPATVIPVTSLNEHIKEFESDKFGSPNYLTWNKGIKAKMSVYKNEFVCFRLVSFLRDKDLLTKVMMSCGALQGIVMRDGAILYGKTLMIKSGREDNTFSLFINTPNKRSKIHRNHHEMEEKTECLLKTIKLNENGKSIEKESDITSKIIHQQLKEDCKAFVDGNVKGSIVSDDVVNHLIESWETESEVDYETKRLLRTYKLTARSDVNVANELGLMILSYTKGSTRSYSAGHTRKLIVVVAKGQALKHIVVDSAGESEEIIFMTNESLYHDWDLAAWKDPEGEYHVTVNNGEHRCTTYSYKIAEDRGNFYKIDAGSTEVDTSDKTCKRLYYDVAQEPSPED